MSKFRIFTLLISFTFAGNIVAQTIKYSNNPFTFFTNVQGSFSALGSTPESTGAYLTLDNHKTIGGSLGVGTEIEMLGPFKFSAQGDIQSEFVSWERNYINLDPSSTSSANPNSISEGVSYNQFNFMLAGGFIWEAGERNQVYLGVNFARNNGFSTRKINPVVQQMTIYEGGEATGDAVFLREDFNILTPMISMNLAWKFLITNRYHFMIGFQYDFEEDLKYSSILSSTADGGVIYGTTKIFNEPVYPFFTLRFFPFVESLTARAYSPKKRKK